ncbi:hypothetical protein F7D01_03955 [Erythrobacter sp. 3-20A1M]|uniref:phospholipase D-like domain-containing protein n=1 Tax=Erythrobacter sp. 3-20A1M TaxID=2653850 RepID=UPI001BFC54C2|nr:phospholipase D-like domain-containing protein [Erythrobacter sp. 3-20A1M]QWC56352.1 hypothetical protein F7D01_03955 [Erythrobacter sp. 3-20A1M]
MNAASVSPSPPGRSTCKPSRGNPRSRDGPTLHAEAFTVAGSTVFIGSFNFDPRSFALNTELGIMIDSPEIAGEMRKVFDDTIALDTYRVVIADGGRLDRHARRRSGNRIHRARH